MPSFRSIGAVLLLAAGSYPGPSLACCVSDLRPLVERIKSFRAVFIGDVESVACTEQWQHPVDGKLRCNVQEATFRVTRAWIPGVSRNTIVMAHPGVSVGYEFQVGQSYLVFARSPGQSGPLWTGACSGTVPKEGAESTLLELDGFGSGYIPE